MEDYRDTLSDGVAQYLIDDWQNRNYILSDVSVPGAGFDYAADLKS